MKRYGLNMLLAIFLVFINLSAATAEDIVSFAVINQTGSDKSSAPVTFGQVFKKGDVPSGQSLSARLTDGTVVPLQVDKKAAHTDGSLRHGIITGSLDLPAGASEIITLATGNTQNTGNAVLLGDLLNSGFDSDVVINIGGINYTASAADMLVNGTSLQWLSGPLVSEWLVGGPVRDSNNNPHPHIAAYFHVRAYAGMKSVRVDVTVENNWTFANNPGAFNYAVDISVGGATKYSNSSLTQYHHTRWHKVFWWGDDPGLVVTHDPEYLQDTLAIPNYASGLSPSDAYLNSMLDSVEPMGQGNLRTRFADTGAGDQIGPLARWDATYAVSGDKRALAASKANASAGGSYSIHYRDENTGFPVSIDNYPFLSENGNPTGLPDPSGGNPLSHDQAHQPSIGYLAYLVTGDYFYLEELHFWANWNMVWTSPTVRQNEKGIFGVQNRGQVWSIRTLAQAAYISPDDHPLKQYFINKLNNNIYDRTVKWANPSANNLGAIQDYDYPKYSPWQNDWFVWVFGYVVELDFTEALTMRAWLSQWPTGRMGVANNEFCFQYAPTYTYPAAAGPTRDTYYPDFRTLYEANYPSQSSQACDPTGDMTGYPGAADGYYSNMQPALAIAVDSGVADYNIHWARFVGVPTKPDYNDKPIWAIVPRQEQGIPLPLITLSATPSSISSATSVSITWSTLNADTCTASGAWSGNKAPNPAQPENILVSQTSTFTLMCTGVGGSTSRSVTVTLSDSGDTDTGSGSDSDQNNSGTTAAVVDGGGGGSVNPSALLLLVLLLLVSWRRTGNQ